MQRNRSPDGECVSEAARVLIESTHPNSRITDEIRLKNCLLLLKKAPSTRAAVLDTISRCIERNVMRLPIFKDSMEEMRRNRDFHKGNFIFFESFLPLIRFQKMRHEMPSMSCLV